MKNLVLIFVYYFFSGLAAGLSVGLSFYARAAITSQVPNGLLGNLLYPIGFILIVIGRYQLFTTFIGVTPRDCPIFALRQPSNV